MSLQMLLPADETIIHHSTDEFGELLITDSALFRTLYFGNNRKQSAMYLQDPDILALNYTQAMMSSLIFNSSPKNALMIGLGGGSMIKFLLKHAPTTAIDGVEIRQSIIRLAHAYFGLPEQHPFLQLHHADAEQFLASKPSAQPYDLIFLDAFHSTGPASLMHTHSFLHNCKNSLSNNGILCINLWTRREDHFKKKIKIINKIFGKACLVLEIDKLAGNALIFAFNNPQMIQNMRQYQSSAAKLKTKTGIDFELFLAMFYKPRFRSWALTF